MKKILAILVPAAMLAYSCETSKYPGYDQSESGLYYKHHKQNEGGRKPVQGDYISMDMTYMTENDSVIYDSRKAGKPVVLMFEQPEYKGDIIEGISMLSEGDSATFIVSADSFFVHNAKAEMPPFIAKGSNLKFHVKVNKVQSPAEMQKEQEELAKAGMQEEMERLADYIAANNITAQPNPSGLYYIENQKGKGPKAEAGKNVKVHYTGRLLDGSIFDTSVEATAKEAGVHNPNRKYEPLAITLGEGSVIPGWEEGIALMNQGGKATLIIPSNLAYGNRDLGVIPPNSTLVFDVELVEVK